MKPPITSEIPYASTPSDQLIIDENENDKREMSDSENEQYTHFEQYM